MRNILSPYTSHHLCHTNIQALCAIAYFLYTLTLKWTVKIDVADILSMESENGCKVVLKRAESVMVATKHATRTSSSLLCFGNLAEVGSTKCCLVYNYAACVIGRRLSLHCHSLKTAFFKFARLTSIKSHFSLLVD